MAIARMVLRVGKGFFVHASTVTKAWAEQAEWEPRRLRRVPKGSRTSMLVSRGSRGPDLAQLGDTAPEQAMLPEARVPQTPADSVPPDGHHPLQMQEPQRQLHRAAVVAGEHPGARRSAAEPRAVAEAAAAVAVPVVAVEDPVLRSSVTHRL